MRVIPVRSFGNAFPEVHQMEEVLNCATDGRHVTDGSWWQLLSALLLFLITVAVNDNLYGRKYVNSWNNW